jgi:cbb3-type cytochrome oxidase cytochrome c subunit
VGPDLSNTGTRLRAGWVHAFLGSPQRYRPWSIHPDYSLSRADLLALTGYLMTKRTQDGAAALGGAKTGSPAAGGAK